jgi:predicted hotdog family 3-hydroxylacyl-ACP dehydratase
MSQFPAIEDLVPHGGGMLLIDRILSAEVDTICAEAVIRRDNIFFRPGRGAPSYIGFELMAQAISAYDGIKRRTTGRLPAIGFLLGCRRYASARPYFLEGETLRIEAVSLLGDEGMASFQCKILDQQGAELASAVISVYRPPDPDAFLGVSKEAGE